MQPKPILGTVLLVLAFASTTVVAAAQQRWATYTNARFGTQASYPADLFTMRDPPPANNDGQSFNTADGRANLRIYGSRNGENDTPQSYLDRLVDLDGVTFERVSARSYVIAGAREGEAFYERCEFPARPLGIIDCISMTFPAREKRTWEPIARRISGSLRGGRGLEPR